MGVPRPERIFAARDLLGAKLDDFAEGAGLSQSYLSEIANHRKPFLDAHADALAEATGLPVDFFYVEAPPIERDSLRFRKLATASPRVTRKAEQYFREVSRVAQLAADSAGLHGPELPVVATEVDLLDQPEIEEAASAVRRLMDQPIDGPLTNLTRAVERLGVVVAPLVLDPLGKDEKAENSPGHFGISHGSVNGLVPVIGYFAGAAPDRDRFTIAHELGHILLHGQRSSSDPEQEANAFAGALLLPASAARHDLHSEMTLNQIARAKAKYGVSIQAIIQRMHRLGIIDAVRQRSLFVQLSSRGWRKSEPVEVVAEYPLLLRRLLELSLPERFTTRAVEQYTSLPRGYVRSMAPPPVRVQDGEGRLLDLGLA